MADDYKDLQVKADDYSDLKSADEVHAAQTSFLSNLQDSGGKFLGGVANAILSPLETAKTTYDLAHGVLGQMIPGFDKDEHANAVAKAFEDHMKERYGGLDNIRHTAYTDPVGFAADLSTVLVPAAGVAGGASKLAEVANLSKTAATLGKVAEAARIGSEVTNPLNVAKGVGKTLSLAGGGTPGRVGAALTKAGNTIQHPVAVTEPFAKRLYRQSLKPSGTTAEATRKVETALREGIMPTDEAKIWERVKGYSQQVESRINDPRAAGLTVHPQDVLDATNKLYDIRGVPGESFNVQVAPADDVSGLQNVTQQFINKHFAPGTKRNPNAVVGGDGRLIPTTAPIPIPLAESQAEKVGTYRMLAKKAFGKTGAGAAEPVPVAKEQAQLELARGHRGAIGDALKSVGIDDIHSINRAEGDVLELRPDIEKAAARNANAGSLNVKNTFMEHALPFAAIQLYKAGKLDKSTLSSILKSLETSATQINATQE